MGDLRFRFERNDGELILEATSEGRLFVHPLNSQRYSRIVGHALLASLGYLSLICSELMTTFNDAQ